MQAEEDKDIIDANVNRIPRNVLEVLGFTQKVNLIELLDSIEKRKDEVASGKCLSEDDYKKSAEWVPRGVAEWLTPEEVLDVVEKLKQYKSIASSDTHIMGKKGDWKKGKQFVLEAIRSVCPEKCDLVNRVFYLKQNAHISSLLSRSQKFLEEHEHIVPKHIGELLGEHWIRLIEDILATEKVKQQAEADGKPFVNPVELTEVEEEFIAANEDKVPRNVLMHLHSTKIESRNQISREKIVQLICDIEMRKSEVSNGQGFDEKLFNENSQLVPQGVAELLTPTQFKKLIEHLKLNPTQRKESKKVLLSSEEAILYQDGTNRVDSPSTADISNTARRNHTSKPPPRDELVEEDTLLYGEDYDMDLPGLATDTNLSFLPPSKK